MHVKRTLRPVRNFLARRGIDVVPTSTAEQRYFRAFQLVREYASGEANCQSPFISYVGEHWATSDAQMFQDLLALFTTGTKRNGYFVEFGATDGVRLSNTLLLERDFGWAGLLAEPGRIWQDGLKRNRIASLDFRCVAGSTGQMVEFSQLDADPLLSSVSAAGGQRDNLTDTSSTNYMVETVSLNDLFLDHQVPRTVDYLSVDTEGTEWEILRSFDFGSYRFGLITVEHNGEPNRTLIHDLLKAQGYQRVLSQLSAWDDWYVAAHSPSAAMLT